MLFGYGHSCLLATIFKIEGHTNLQIFRHQHHPTASEQELHENIQIYRDKVVAHSDIDKMRIGFHTFESGLGDMKLPYIRWDEGLEFTDQIADWINWIRKLMQGLSLVLWEVAQEADVPASFIKDSLNSAEPTLLADHPTISSGLKK